MFSLITLSYGLNPPACEYEVLSLDALVDSLDLLFFFHPAFHLLS